MSADKRPAVQLATRKEEAKAAKKAAKLEDKKAARKAEKEAEKEAKKAAAKRQRDEDQQSADEKSADDEVEDTPLAEEDQVALEERSAVYATWPVLPAADATGPAAVFGKTAAAKGAAAMTTPTLRLAPGWARCDVVTGSDCSLGAALFAVQLASDIAEIPEPLPAVTAQAEAAASISDMPSVVVLCGSLASLHAAAWAARCRRVPVFIVASTSDVAARQSPRDVLAEIATDLGIASRTASAVPSVVLLLSSVLKVEGQKRGTDPAAWLGGRTMVALPDVADAADLQPMNCRAVTLHAAPDADDEGSSAWPRLSRAMQAVEPTAEAGAGAVKTSLTDLPAPRRCDSSVSTALVARGSVSAALRAAVRLHGTSDGRATQVEDALFAALLFDRGAKAEAGARGCHHKLAAVLRLLVDSSAAAEHDMAHRNNPKTLAHLAARCVTRVVRTLPPLPEEPRAVGGDAADKIVGHGLSPAAANPFLHATLCYCFRHIPLAITDALAAAWGISRVGVIGGLIPLRHHSRLRAEAVHKLRMSYATRCGERTADFLVVLTHMLADMTSRSVGTTVVEVERRMMWNETLYGDCGPIGAFLVAAGLLHSQKALAASRSRSALVRSKQLAAAAALHAAEDEDKGGRKTRSTAAAVASFSADSVVKPLPSEKFLKLPFLQMPLAQAKARRRSTMASMALDEILSAMPSSKNVPMYVGDVGALIGKWTSFNARYGGRLGISLQVFLEAHPEEFRVVTNVVTRVKDSVSAPIRVRHDDPNNKGDDSDDDDGTKRRKSMREMLDEAKGKARGGKPLSVKRKALAEAEARVKAMPLRSKTKRRRMTQLRNKARYNTNHKVFDQSAKVKGYSKPQSRKISGRGKKKNIRTTKRN